MSMIKNKQGFFLGIFILLIWTFFGIATSWKIFFTILSALYLIIISIKITLPSRSGLKRQVRRREKVTPVFSESAPIAPAPKMPEVENLDQKTNNEI